MPVPDCPRPTCMDRRVPPTAPDLPERPGGIHDVSRPLSVHLRRLDPGPFPPSLPPSLPLSFPPSLPLSLLLVLSCFLLSSRKQLECTSKAPPRPLSLQRPSLYRSLPPSLPPSHLQKRFSRLLPSIRNDLYYKLSAEDVMEEQLYIVPLLTTYGKVGFLLPSLLPLPQMRKAPLPSFSIPSPDTRDIPYFLPPPPLLPAVESSEFPPRS
jgi:hypothetical protein